MALKPQILFAKVMHKRLIPKVNAFTYGIYYIACPLSLLDQMNNGFNFGVERPALLSFYARDHGARDGGSLETWIREILRAHDLNDMISDITLVTMPRVLGYVFNPVSFWLCRDSDGALRSVLCEVNNTFGETHSYLCAHEDRRPIENDDWLVGNKFFHVSPFMQREGCYRFRFATNNRNFGAWIDHTDGNGATMLLTALTGQMQKMTPDTLRRAFYRYPLVTLKAVLLIHWQAIKLLAKGIKYVPKPSQKNDRLTGTTNVTKF